MFAEIYLLLTIFSVVFLAVGAFQKSYPFFVMGGVLLSVVGLLLWSTGYQTDKISTFETTRSILPDGNTFYSSVPIYDTLTKENDWGIWTISILSIFGGIAFILGSYYYISIYGKKTTGE
jgi:hypothetical protein